MSLSTEPRTSRRTSCSYAQCLVSCPTPLATAPLPARVPTWQGDALVLVSAALYAMKGVMYKKWFGGTVAASPAESGAPQMRPPPTPIGDGAVTVGLMGFWSVLIGAVVLLTAHYSGVEPFTLPPPPMLGGYVLVALLMTVYMSCLLAALAYATPTFVAVVSLFVTPVTLLWDVLAGRARGISAMALCGMALLLVALLAVIFHEQVDGRLKRRVRALATGLGLSPSDLPLLVERPVNTT